jgi:hypothetical protein
VCAPDVACKGLQHLTALLPDEAGASSRHGQGRLCLMSEAGVQHGMEVRQQARFRQ